MYRPTNRYVTVLTNKVFDSAVIREEILAEQRADDRQRRHTAAARRIANIAITDKNDTSNISNY